MIRKTKDEYYRFYRNRTTGEYHIGTINLKKDEVRIEDYKYPFHSHLVLDDFEPVEKEIYANYLAITDTKKWRKFIDTF